jgi:predicted RecB family nuclease
MSIEQLTTNDAGDLIVPQSDADWRDWVSATRTRNYVLGDPLLDWLELHGASKGFERDPELPGYDSRTDFTEFLFAQGRRFEEAVVRHLRTLHPVLTISNGPGDVRSLSRAEETFGAMREGAPLIHQGVLRDPQYRTYGAPDLLVRSDVLAELFPEAIETDQASAAAPDLDGGWHYRVVDIKFTTLHLSARGELANYRSSPAYKLQLFAYNRALGRIQGLEPPTSYLLGRGWEKRGDRGFSCMEHLGPVSQGGALARGRRISEAQADAARWVRRVRTEGRAWDVLPAPSMPELYPNSSNQQDGPWRAAKRRIAEELEDLTLLWQVAERGRRLGHEAGVYRWTDPACTPAVVGVTGDKRPDTFQKLLDINRSDDGPPVRPARIHAARGEWSEEPDLEFYVDFETVNDLADDFSGIPQRGGQPLIFMIGCGHIEDGEWSFASFVVDSLTEPEEARIIDDWVSHMQRVRDRLATNGDEPRVIHWSPAEVSNFETAYNSAKERHPLRDWPSPRWFDFLGEVVREEPVVIRGALGFGLKAVARALHAHGLIETLWSDGPADGLGAMVGAWWCQQQGSTLTELDLMQEIVRYNEVDCRVMMEAVRHFRREH